MCSHLDDPTTYEPEPCPACGYVESDHGTLADNAHDSLCCGAPGGFTACLWKASGCETHGWYRGQRLAPEVNWPRERDDGSADLLTDR